MLGNKITCRIRKCPHDSLDGSFENDEELSANDIILCKNKESKKP